MGLSDAGPQESCRPSKAARLVRPAGIIYGTAPPPWTPCNSLSNTAPTHFKVINCFLKKLNPGAELVVDDKSEDWSPSKNFSRVTEFAGWALARRRRKSGPGPTCPETRPWHRLGKDRGSRPDGCLEGPLQCCALSRISEPSVQRFEPFTRVASVEDGQARPSTPSEEREPMSEDSTSDDEQPEVDDSTLSEVVRRPTRTAGDLSEVADATHGITTEDLARDLEAVASRQGVPSASELLADLLRRVERIEEHLGITN